MNNEHATQRPKLGEWRKLTATTRRKGLNIGGGFVKRTWEREAFRQPVSGMFIGSRTGNNGRREWIGEGEYGYYSFIFDEPVTLWLFVTGVNRKPIYVFPADAHFEEIETAS